MSKRLRALGVTAFIAAVYFGAAYVGLTLATVGRSVTLVWPPTGIALAALFLLGRRCWPGVALGAFLVNALTPGLPAPAAAGIAAGNTLEALAGASILLWLGVDRALARARDVVALMVGAGLLSTTASATVGVASLWLGGVVPASGAAAAWLQWWMGDALGAVVVAPALLAWTTPATWKAMRARPVEALASAVVTVAAAAVVFGNPAWLDPLIAPLPYMAFPGLMWMSLRFGPRGGTAAALGVSVLAVVGTVAGHGPLVGPTLVASLMQLDMFLAVVALTALLLGALAAERQRALTLRDEFIALASHELRTPLTPIKLQLQLLRRNSTDPDLPRRLDTVDRQLVRLTRLVEELLDTSRMSSGWSLQRERVDLGALAQEVVGGLKEELDAAGCAAQVQSGGEVMGDWDPIRLQQVVTNLVTNAMKFGAGKPIGVFIQGMGEQAELKVIDEGIGIPPAEQRRIFEPFERAREAAGVSGLGLGLYVVRRVVEAHGGRVSVHSQPGRGSTFTVRLPRFAPLPA